MCLERLSSDPPVAVRRGLLLTFQRNAKGGDSSLRFSVKVLADVSIQKEPSFCEFGSCLV